MLSCVLLATGCAGSRVGGQTIATNVPPSLSRVNCADDPQNAACAINYPPAESPAPNEQVIGEDVAAADAIRDFNASPDATHSEKLITYAEWPNYGGSSSALRYPDRAAWVVGVNAVPDFPDVGPIGHTKIAADSYTVLLDGYSGQVVEFIAKNVLAQ